MNIVISFPDEGFMRCYLSSGRCTSNIRGGYENCTIKSIVNTIVCPYFADQNILEGELDDHLYSLLHETQFGPYGLYKMRIMEAVKKTLLDCAKDFQTMAQNEAQGIIATCENIDLDDSPHSSRSSSISSVTAVLDRF